MRYNYLIKQKKCEHLGGARTILMEVVMDAESVNDMYEQADVLYVMAKEYYEIGDITAGAEYENKFMQLLNRMMKLGIDREYMGIA